MAQRPCKTSGGGQFHFDPKTYLQNIRNEVPDYDELQDTIANFATSGEINRFLDLGAGTGETSLRVIRLSPKAEAVLVEEQESMVAILRERFSDFRATLSQSDFGQKFPEGPYCVAVSLFAVHHLKGEKKKELFQRIYTALKSNGLWVFGDVYIPSSPSDRKTPIDRVHDFPSTMKEVEEWLTEVGFSVSKVWHKHDLAVYACRK